MRFEQIYKDSFEILTGQKVGDISEIPPGTMSFFRDVAAGALLRATTRWRRSHGKSYGKIAVEYGISRKTAVMKCKGVTNLETPTP